MTHKIVKSLFSLLTGKQNNSKRKKSSKKQISHPISDNKNSFKELADSLNQLDDFLKEHPEIDKELKDKMGF